MKVALKSQIFYSDKTFLLLNISCEKVLVLKNSKHVYTVLCGTSEHITLLCCAPIDWYRSSTNYNIFKELPGGNYKFDGPDDALNAKSNSRWIDSELFLPWMTRTFFETLWFTKASFTLCWWSCKPHHIRCNRLGLREWCNLVLPPFSHYPSIATAWCICLQIP